MKKFVILCTLLVAAAASVRKLNWDNVHEYDISLKDIKIPAIKPGQRIEGRITGGREALPHEFPYQVGIYMLLPPPYPGAAERTAWCGGALISNRVVLTAAHCLASTSKGIVFLGAHNIQDQNEVGRQTILVTPKDFIVNTGFSEDNPIDDIALIILPKEAQLNEYVQTVNLPKPMDLQYTFEGRLAGIAGWGQTGDSINDGPSSVLRVAFLRILNGNSCRIYYPNLFFSKQICVSGADKISACAGDSGGPLVIQGRDDSKTIIGLVSFGRKEGCQKGYPSVFTRITSYLDWIEKHTGISANN